MQSSNFLIENYYIKLLSKIFFQIIIFSINKFCWSFWIQSCNQLMRFWCKILKYLKNYSPTCKKKKDRKTSNIIFLVLPVNANFNAIFVSIISKYFNEIIFWFLFFNFSCLAFFSWERICQRWFSTERKRIPKFHKTKIMKFGYS